MLLPPQTPPSTPQSDQTNDFHDTPIADPYRWLEDASDPDVQADVWAFASHTLGMLLTSKG